MSQQDIFTRIYVDGDTDSLVVELSEAMLNYGDDHPTKFVELTHEVISSLFEICASVEAHHFGLQNTTKSIH